MQIDALSGALGRAKCEKTRLGLEVGEMTHPAILRGGIGDDFAPPRGGHAVKWVDLEIGARRWGTVRHAGMILTGEGWRLRAGCEEALLASSF
jgi:hypothetical protein